jgi:hypothetical protein
MKLYTILVVLLISLAPAFAIQGVFDGGQDDMGFGQDGTGMLFDPTVKQHIGTLTPNNMPVDEPTLESSKVKKTVASTPKNYYPSQQDLENGYIKCMKIGKRIYFDFEGAKQSVSLKNTKGGFANFAFSFDEEFSFLPGDMETFDVNEDGVDDYSVNLIGFCDENRAEFLVTALFKTEEVIEEEVAEEGTPAEEKPSVIPSDKPVVRNSEPAGNAITGKVVADTENTGSGFSEWFKNLFGF